MLPLSARVQDSSARTNVLPATSGVACQARPDAPAGEEIKTAALLICEDLRSPLSPSLPMFVIFLKIVEGQQRQASMQPPIG